MKIKELKDEIINIEKTYGNEISSLFKPFLDENIYSFIKGDFLIIFNAYSFPKINKINIKAILDKRDLGFNDFLKLKADLDKQYYALSIIDEKKASYRNSSILFKREELRLNMSNYCSLRCKYCFQSHKNTQRMDIDKCYKQIDDFIKETLRKRTVKVTMNMTSEPFLDFASLKKVYNYLQEKCLEAYKKEVSIEEIYDFLNISTDLEYQQILLQKDYYKGCFENIDRRFITSSLEEKIRLVGHSEDEEYIKSVNKDVIYTCMSAKENLYYFFLNTNGTITPNDSELQFLKKLYSQSHLGISLDGDKKYSKDRTYNNGKSSYNKVMKNIEFFQKNGIKLRVNCTVTETHNDFLRLIKFFKKHNIENFDFNIKKGAFSKSLIKNIDKVYKAYFSGKIDSLHGLESYFDKITTNKISFTNCLALTRKTIGYDNEEYFCEYFISSKNKNIVNVNVLKREPCNKCPFSLVCGGTCMALTNGDISIKKEACETKKELIKQSIFYLS